MGVGPFSSQNCSKSTWRPPTGATGARSKVCKRQASIRQKYINTKKASTGVFSAGAGDLILQMCAADADIGSSFCVALQICTALQEILDESAEQHQCLLDLDIGKVWNEAMSETLRVLTLERQVPLELWGSQ